jgi:hypothetical protein
LRADNEKKKKQRTDRDQKAAELRKEEESVAKQLEAARDE